MRDSTQHQPTISLIVILQRLAKILTVAIEPSLRQDLHITEQITWLAARMTPATFKQGYPLLPFDEFYRLTIKFTHTAFYDCLSPLEGEEHAGPPQFGNAQNNGCPVGPRSFSVAVEDDAKRLVCMLQDTYRKRPLSS